MPGTNVAPTSLSLPGIDIMSGVRVAMRDGVELATDIYLPPDSGPCPTLLVRTPYGKRDVTNQGYAHPAWYAAQGFAVVHQDVRGRWDSSGVFYPYAHEATDGADAIAWVSEQPWCNGAVGTYGFSYPGATQLLAASQSPPALKAMAPAMTGRNYCEGWTYQNGAFHNAFILSWVAALAKDQAMFAGDAEAEAALADLFSCTTDLYGHLPVREAVPTKWQQKYASYLSDWFDHPTYDDYWKQWAPQESYDAMQAPGLHIAGWYDVFLEGTIDNFVALRKRGQAHHMLVVGPWYHMPWSQHVGEVDFGTEGRNVMDEIQVKFFGRWLRGDDNGIEDEPPVRLFVTGSNRWREEDAWPPKGSQARALHLASDGRACSINGTGRLQDEPVSGDAPVDAFSANPLVPVISLGGRSCCYADSTPMGAVDQRSQEIRNDVLVFDGDTLDRDVTCIGVPIAILHVAADVPNVDFVVRLVDVHPNGQAINICDGIARLSDIGTSQGVQEVRIALAPMANCFQAGHRIRLDIAGSSFPTFDRNPHTGVDPRRATSSDCRVATQFVFHDARYPSRIEVPVVAD